MEPLLDRLGRPLETLRISITDRCNFRCVYCMPKEVFGRDYAFLERRELLTFEELARVVGIFAGLGVQPVAEWVLHHHERWDGAGYPNRLAGDQIPLGARIIFVADAYDAMTSDRAYRGRLTPQEAVAELQRCAGTQFDPEIVEVFARELGYAPVTSLAAR